MNEFDLHHRYVSFPESTKRSRQKNQDKDTVTASFAEYAELGATFICPWPLLLRLVITSPRTVTVGQDAKLHSALQGCKRCF